MKQSRECVIEEKQLLQLQRNFLKYESLFAHYPGMMYLLDHNGIITEINDFSEKLSRHSNVQIKNKHYKQFLSNSEYDKVHHYFNDTLLGNVTHFQTIFLSPDHEPFDVELINIPVFIEGVVEGVFTLVRDITNERAAAFALKDSKEKYRLIAEHTSELIRLVNVESEMVMYASPSHENVLGSPPAYYMGHSFYKDIHPDDRGLVDDLLRNINQEPAIVEFRRRHANGYWVILEDRATSIPSRIGDERMLVVVSRDITEKKHAERELQKTLKQLKDLKYALDESALVSVTDETGKITSVNAKFCEITEYSEDELLRNSHMILDSGYHPQSFFYEMNCKIQSGGVWKGEINNLTKNGHCFWVDTTIVPFIGENGAPYQYVYIRKDITDRKHAEELLHTSDKLSVIGELAAGVAHEIRNPLTSLKGFTQILKSRLNSENDQEFISIMLAELDRINMIVNEFMVLARPQAVTYEKTDIQELLQNVLTLIETQAILNNVQIYTRVIEHLPEITCSENQIKQVLINILKNAIEAMTDGGEIILSLYSFGDEIIIEVRDSGTGIPEHQLAHLGEPFYTTKKKGNGLGLMICRRIIQNHQGSFLIESKEGEGTVVSIKLPFQLSQDERR
ncbi:PAS domain-containing protein [Guptibacillus hwajinpoensis]|uniref:PAS domain-containing protein n=1 Tax=Guptibacillus hwajinpoensis TaxID=208199 RepID=UPI003851432D